MRRSLLALRLIVMVDTQKEKESDVLKIKAKVRKNSTKEEKARFPAASVMLEVSMDEYTKERERTNTLDNKANAFISVIIAFFTLYIPIIPFSKLTTAYSQLGKAMITCVTIVLTIMASALVLMIIAFVNLYSGFKIKAFYRVQHEALNNPEVLNNLENNVKKGLIDHYNTIIRGNSDINTQKAQKISIGLRYSIISFILLSLSTIMLIILLGGVRNV